MDDTAVESSQHAHVENKDDWTIDESGNESVFNTINAPSFVRLFVINRIIREYINTIVGDDPTINETISILNKLCNVFKNETLNVNNKEVELESKARDILLRLITDGLKKYMNDWYNEQEQAIIIEMIFNKMIIANFEEEYNQLITYVGKNKYENLLFNSTDLMANVFQYLEYGEKFDGDLVECSLVNSHWLYHSWNVRSVYYVDFDQLIEQTSKYGADDNNNILRIWQRLTNAKDVYFNNRNVKFTKFVLNRLLMMKNIRNVTFTFHDVDSTDICVVILKTLFSKWKDKIEWCCLDAESTLNENAILSPLKLLNCRYIEICDVYFYRMWSNKCKELVLSPMGNIDSNWCKYVINHCDCSGIKILELRGIEFCDKASININQCLLKQLLLKFNNLEKLSLYFSKRFDSNISFLIQCLRPIIKSNDGSIELEFDYSFTDWDKINKIWNKDNLDANVDMCKICLDSGFAEEDLELIHFIGEKRDDIYDIKTNTPKKNNCLTYLNFSTKIDWDLLSLCLSFESIDILQLNIDFDYCYLLSAFLEWNLYTIDDAKETLFIVVNGDCMHTHYTDFEQVCKNIVSLLDKQMPIDIHITIDTIYEEEINKCKEIYAKYFQDRKLLDNYKAPKCNMSVCRPCVKPLTVLTYVHDQGFYLRVLNVNSQHVK